VICCLFLREASVFVVLVLAGGGLGQQIVSLPEPAVVSVFKFFAGDVFKFFEEVVCC